MKILFLTNNPQTSDSLYDWLVAYGEDVLYESEPINAVFVKENDIEFIVSYNYIHIIKQDVIDLLPHRIINLHISMLPWNRGMIPNIWSFLEGTPTGVTIHEVDAGLDTGDILIQREINFNYKTETLKTSYEKSHALMRELFCENWDKIKNGLIMPKSQKGTMHFKKDAILFEHIINYDDTIEAFLDKYYNILSPPPPQQSTS
jgi:methionyl-tRNA formyltransferase